jgi:hypothetical protein
MTSTFPIWSIIIVFVFGASNYIPFKLIHDPHSLVNVNEDVPLEGIYLGANEIQCVVHLDRIES